MKSLSVFSLSLLSAAVYCNTALADNTERSPRLDPVVVTATRLPEQASHINAAVTVISREQIEERQVGTLKELLEQESGITLASTGGPLTTTSLFLRGSASKQVLVLVDGVRVNDANQGAFDFSLLQTADIDRVEIVRGPYSSQYGSDAIGGVIQIFTRRHAGVSLTARAGRYGTREGQAAVGFGTAKNGFSISTGYFETEGFNATNTAWGDPDRDGGQVKNVALAGWSSLSDDVELRLNSRWQNSRPEFDNGVSDQDTGTASAELKQRLNERWSHSLQLGWLRNQLDTPAFASRFNTERQSTSWVHQLRWAENMQLVAGADFYEEKAINQGSFDERLHNAGIFATQHLSLGLFSASLALRQDEHDSFGGHTSGSLNLGWQLAEGLKLYQSLGSAFRAPSANDLYYTGFFGFFMGNPDLDPERSRQGEVGLEYFWHAQHKARLSAYRNEVKDLIAAGPDTNMTNIAQARLEGVELELQGQLSALDYSLNAGLLSAKDANDKDLVRRPKKTLNASTSYALSETLRAGVELRARSGAKDGGSELPGYTTGNLFASWQLNENLRLGARLENLSDKQYTEVAGYNTARRAGYVSVNYAWQ